MFYCFEWRFKKTTKIPPNDPSAGTFHFFWHEHQITRLQCVPTAAHLPSASLLREKICSHSSTHTPELRNNSTSPDALSTIHSLMGFSVYILCCSNVSHTCCPSTASEYCTHEEKNAVLCNLSLFEDVLPVAVSMCGCISQNATREKPPALCTTNSEKNVYSELWSTLFLGFDDKSKVYFVVSWSLTWCIYFT